MENQVNLTLVSIIVPVYNIEKYIVSCIESIVAQSYRNIEIILVDDGSTDSSGKICDEYQSKHANIIVIHKDNEGLSEARNIGIRAAHGELISFVDGDDIIHPQFIEQLVNALVKDNSDISISPIRRFYCNEESKFLQSYVRDFETTLLSNEQSLKEMLREGKFDISSCGKLYKTVLFNGISYPVGEIFEDLATTYKLAAKANRIAFINIKLYGYRVRAGSIMHDAFNNKMLFSITACDEFCNFMKQKYPDCDKEISYRKAKTATILLERISFGNNASEYKEITNSMKKAIKAELMTVILDANVQLAQKIKMICGANSIKLLRIASDIYEKLYFIYDKISIS